MRAEVLCHMRYHLQTKSSQSHHMLRDFGTISIHSISRVVFKTEEAIHFNLRSSTKPEVASA